jgi:hypothetical protein
LAIPLLGRIPRQPAAPDYPAKAALAIIANNPSRTYDDMLNKHL